MRARRSRVEEYYLKKKKVTKDREGSTQTVYGKAVRFEGVAWPATGKIQAQMYGQRLPYIYNLKIDKEYTVKMDEKGVLHYICNDLDIVEGDGICLYANRDGNPDYRIISIKPYRFLKIEVEKI